jgi:signal transduction histidine kinase
VGLLSELKSYVGFGAEDEEALRRLHPVAAPSFVQIADVFYDRILAHAEARRTLEQGESRVGQLKLTLVSWLDSLLLGPWDAAYFERRCRIGRVHVRIGLPQHYMMGAMNVVRDALAAIVDAELLSEVRIVTHRALGKVLDLELAIMLHTYRESLLTQAAQAERLATFGQLVGSIGHELRNPLAVIETSLYLLRSRQPIGDERTQRHLDRIDEQLGLANGIITTLLDMIRDRPLQPQRFTLEELVQAARSQVAIPDTLTVELDLGGERAQVVGDATQLRQAVVNLLANAVDALAGGGRIRLSTVLRTPNRVALLIDDSGPGVSDVVRARLFEPLVTSKPNGIGLGLALVRRIAERHGGTVGYERSPLGGARFCLELPSDAAHA